jgi:transposase
MAQRKHHGGAFKTRVAVEAIAGHKTINEIASAYAIHPSLVTKWKAEALARLPEVLSDGRSRRRPGHSEKRGCTRRSDGCGWRWST